MGLTTAPNAQNTLRTIFRLNAQYNFLKFSINMKNIKKISEKIAETSWNSSSSTKLGYTKMIFNLSKNIANWHLEKSIERKKTEQNRLIFSKIFNPWISMKNIVGH